MKGIGSSIMALAASALLAATPLMAQDAVTQSTGNRRGYVTHSRAKTATAKTATAKKSKNRKKKKAVRSVAAASAGSQPVGAQPEGTSTAGAGRRR